MEMGQGLHTKMIQVVARALEISHELVHIAEAATNVVANANPTNASMSSDLYGMALLDACEQLTERLRPVVESLSLSNAERSWRDIVQRAHEWRIDLTAHGFYKVPNLCDDVHLKSKRLKKVEPMSYFTEGVACTEVEVDLLTGDSRIIRADVFMDVGQSLNPALDIGQIEGAFMQGFGWSTMEELIWGDNDHHWVKKGNLLTRGPGNYKIPSFNDVPEDFRVTLLDGNNARAVHSSKGIGEPPFFMGCSAFFAIRNAVKAARAKSDRGGEYFQFNLPATSERIRMACVDGFVEGSVSAGEGSTAASYQAKGSW